MLPPGVTEFGFAQSLRTRVESMTDAMGNTTSSRTGFFEDRQTDLSIAHAFGSFEVGLGADSYHLYAWVSIDTHSVPAGFNLNASMRAPQSDGRYLYAQRATIEHKVVIAPKRFALHGSASIELYEVNGDNAQGMRVKGSVITSGARFLTETQLLRRLGLYAGVSGGAPVYETCCSRCANGISTPPAPLD